MTPNIFEDTKTACKRHVLACLMHIYISTLYLDFFLVLKISENAGCMLLKSAALKTRFLQ